MKRAVFSAAILAITAAMAAFPALAQDLPAVPGEPLDGDQTVTRAECERFNRLHGTEIDCGCLPEDVSVTSENVGNDWNSVPILISKDPVAPADGPSSSDRRPL